MKIYLLVISFFITLSDVNSQGNNNFYRKYSLSNGYIKYELSGADYPVHKYLEITFSNYGSREVITGSLLDSLPYNKLIANDSLQTYYKNGNFVLKKKRQANFIIDKFIRKGYSLYNGIFLAKGFKRRFLHKKCQGFGHFDFRNKNELIGTVLYHKDIVMYARVYDTKKNTELIIKAVEIDFP